VQGVSDRSNAKAAAPNVAAPFIRWAGAKRRQQKVLLSLAPPRFNRYHEPFLGSGAFFFALRPNRAVLADRIEPLMKTWTAVRDCPATVAEHIAHWPVDSATYYEVRALAPTDPALAAARFIYLNKTCYNGLYRVNAAGKFNVPFGRPKSSNVASQESLVACASLLKGEVTLLHGDFESSLDGARRGDLVYLDPPYVTGHSNNGFVEYNEVLFNWDDQVRLARVARRLAAAGVQVMVSNAWHESVLQLYKGFRVTQISTHSSMAGASAKRTRVSEAVFHLGRTGELIQ
jgi:DNA adenine methylase